MGAIDALEGWMDAWKAQDWVTMFSFIQRTALEIKQRDKYGVEHGYSAATLEGEYCNLLLTRYRVIKETAASEVCVDFTVDVSMRSGERRLDRCVLARVICESAPYTPSPTGTWGVNPVSVRKLREKGGE